MSEKMVSEAAMVRPKAIPVRRRVSGVFIPVRDVDRAREWYRDVLGLQVGEVISGHLCCVPMENGLDLLLDQKLSPEGPVEGIERGMYPLFMLATHDIGTAAAFLRERGVELVAYHGEVIQNGHWLNFRDCDGNLLMMCA
jgi:catechol 2,3-dioxygenase-like lactoylglutathione lyase family enzyme